MAIDVDASLRFGPLHLGVRRSPVHTAGRGRGLAQQIARRGGVRLVGLMLYDAQIAGLPDASAAVRLVKRRSDAELRPSPGRGASRRSRPYADLEFVNGGGTGSLQLTTRRRPASPRSPAGSGLYGPTLFDGYRAFTPRPAAFFVSSGGAPARPGIATVLRRRVHRLRAAGLGPACRHRVWPPGLELRRQRGAGEVQTPLARRAGPVGCGSATRSGSGTPRPARPASGSTGSTWSAAGELVDTVPDLPRRGAGTSDEPHRDRTPTATLVQLESDGQQPTAAVATPTDPGRLGRLDHRAAARGATVRPSAPGTRSPRSRPPTGCRCDWTRWPGSAGSTATPGW